MKVLRNGLTLLLVGLMAVGIWRSEGTRNLTEDLEAVVAQVVENAGEVARNTERIDALAHRLAKDARQDRRNFDELRESFNHLLALLVTLGVDTSSIEPIGASNAQGTSESGSTDGSAASGGSGDLPESPGGGGGDGGSGSPPQPSPDDPGEPPAPPDPAPPSNPQPPIEGEGSLGGLGIPLPTDPIVCPVAPVLCE